MEILKIFGDSRFNWLGTLAYAYRSTFDKKYLNVINDWLNDCYTNPMNIGPNWKCGREQ